MGGDDTTAVCTSRQLSSAGSGVSLVAPQSKRSELYTLHCASFFAISLPFAQLRILLALVMCRTLFRAMA